MAEHLTAPVAPRASRAAPRNTLARARLLAVETLKAYFKDSVSRLGAALAYYALFAVAPLLVLAIAFASMVFDEESARQRVIGQIEQLAGSEASRAIIEVEQSTPEKANALATVVGLGTLLVGGIGVFIHLQDALNTIWHVKPREGEPWFRMLKRRLFSLGAVLATGFLLLVSLIVSATLGWAGERMAHLLNLPDGVLHALNFAVSFAVTAFLFAMIFRLLPDARIRWRAVWLGGVVTAGLFVVGKSVLGYYLSRTDVTSSYGVAGSFVALLVWVYYASQILFLGAEFTRVHAGLIEGGLEAEPHAEADDKT